MKIAYIINGLGNSGGIERVLSTKANYLADVLEMEVHIIVGGKQPDSLFFHFSGKIRFHYLDMEFPPMDLLQYFFGSGQNKIYRQQLEQKLNEVKPDITLSMFGQELSFLYKLKDGSKKVLEFHFSRNYLTHLVEGLPNSKLKWLRKLWVSILQYRERYYSKKYNHIVLLTEKDKLLWKGDNRFSVIPNPLSFVSNEKADLENKTIVAMGRFIAQKGFDLLIRAFALLKEEFPGWKVFIYGEGGDAGYLKDLINKMSLENNVFLKEPVKDVEGVMLDSSLFVFPSRYEGFGLVLMEAMTCGVPCVAFDCECGPSDIIEDKVDGFLAPANEIEVLAERMRLLMADKELRIKMGTAAIKNVKRFDTSIVMGRWEKYLKQIIS